MWLMHRPGEEKEVTWEQTSEFHKDLNLNFTVSEIDSEKKVEVFYNEQNPVNSVDDSEHNATNFLTQYQIYSHQGIENSLFAILLH